METKLENKSKQTFSLWVSPFFELWVMETELWVIET